MARAGNMRATEGCARIFRHFRPTLDGFAKAGKRPVALLSSVTAIAALSASVAIATENVSYSYDARGRLVQVSRSGTVNNGAVGSYSYDSADNRTNVTVSVGGGTTPSFSIANASATEGSAVVFTVTKAGSASTSLTVNYATSSGTAVSGTDFTAASGTLTFLPADTSKTISVPTTDDSSVESSENFAVTLSNASSGSTIGTTQATGTINDNDAAAPSFAINDVSATEGGNLSFTATKTGSTSSSFTVNYATANGTALAGSDYNATSGTLTFLAGEATKTVTVATIDDGAVESAETLLVNLSGASGGATISDSQGVGTINDNDTPPPNTPPVAVSNSASVQMCKSVTVNVTSNDTDADGDYPLTVTGVSGADLGNASVVSASSIKFNAAGDTGTDSLTYTIQDSRGASASGTLSITVAGGFCQ